MSDPVFELEGVRFTYPGGAAPVVRDLAASVQAGRLHVVLGPNAAGKSTLLRLMLGQLRPDAGRVALAGQTVGRLTPRRRAALVSYVPQRSAVGFAFTVGQIVRMGRFALSPDEGAVAAAIDRCDLAALADRPFPHLSVGQQQRVLLARAVAQAAGGGRAMLLDEPVSAMDLSHVHRVMRTLRELTADGLACVVVLHDLNLAAQYADSVWLMDDGRMVEAGPWPTVLRPELLEPVYGVRIEELRRGRNEGGSTGPRPIFDTRLPDEADAR